MGYGKWLSAVLLAVVLFQPSQIADAGSRCTCEDNGGTCNCEKTAEQILEEWENRCRCANPAAEPEPARKTVSSSGNEVYSDTYESDTWKEEEQPRFIEIFRDESFVYWMDRKTARYLSVPHLAREKMIDVWIKLEPLEYLEGDYTYPAKYYLEHYLLRPKKQQIQFLAEMEVQGRPTAQAENRRYDGRRWENLVPGSIEDLIYHAVLAHKDEIYDESSANGTAIRDFIENTINVSL